MSQQWFQNLMNEFFRSLGLNELPPALPVHVLSVDDTMELLLGHEPSRSEEHTSELQSLAQLACRLLLEKKKQPAYPNE